MLRRRDFLSLTAGVLTGAVLNRAVLGLDTAHKNKADAVIADGLRFLRGTQGADGSWSPQPGPAITAMALTVLLDHGFTTDDPTVARALAYVLSKARPDGGIHDGFIENYNTAICLSALSRLKDRPDVAPLIKKAQDNLRNLQWWNQLDPQGKPIDESHPYFGGAGYGKHGRPDLSNTHLMLEGLYDSGLDCNDPAFQRAIVFIERLQGTASNKTFGDKIVRDGGFIYATSVNKDNIGVPQSMAGEVETVDASGQAGSLLRTYGSMTYAGFKSYLYAQMDRDDPRVRDALSWIRANYTVDHNPGMPEQRKLEGHYYYLVTFSRALRAWGEETITLADGQNRDWANDLVEKIASMQHPDGSWINPADRWMESDANLVTCYALLALTHATK